MRKAEAAVPIADNRVKIESKSIAVDKELSMAEFYGRLICNSKKRGILSLLVAIPCEYSTEEAHHVYAPEEAARVVDKVYGEVDIMKKKIKSRAFANAKEHDLLDRLLADPYDAEIEIEAWLSSKSAHERRP